MNKSKSTSALLAVLAGVYLILCAWPTFRYVFGTHLKPSNPPVGYNLVAVNFIFVATIAYGRNIWGAVLAKKAWIRLLCLNLALCLLADFSLLNTGEFHLFALACTYSLAFILVTHALFRCVAPFVWGFLLLLGGLVSYARFTMDIQVTPAIMAEVLGTSPQDAVRFVTVEMVIAVIILLAVCLFICYALHRALRDGKKTRVFLVGVILAIPSLINSAMLGIPAWSPMRGQGIGLDSLALQLAQASRIAIAQNENIIKLAESLPSPADMPTSISTLQGGEGVIAILHIGESVRADHLSFNGYGRDTTPWLQSNPRLISYADCVSAAPMTTGASFAILTNGRGNSESANVDESLQPTTGCVMDLFKANRFKCVAFFDPQGENTTWGTKMARLLKMYTRSADNLVYTQSQDIMLQVAQIHREIDKANKANQFLLVNNLGSHLPFMVYDKKNPPFEPADEKAYYQQPATNSESATRALNAYDNTIRYTDDYICKLLTPLQRRPFLYVYVSDHGEAVGENNEWVRCVDTERYHTLNMSKVGFFIVYSPEFESLSPHFAQALEQLKKHRDMSVAHEHIFHTLLGIFGISSPYYDATLDLTNEQCKPYAGPHPSRGGASADGKKWH